MQKNTNQVELTAEVKQQIDQAATNPLASNPFEFGSAEYWYFETCCVQSEERTKERYNDFHNSRW